MECKHKKISPTKNNLIKDVENFCILNPRSITNSKNEYLIKKVIIDDDIVVRTLDEWKFNRYFVHDCNF